MPAGDRTESSVDDTAFMDANDAPHCLACDYCLRGLGGDPLRCPECGRGNTAVELAGVSELAQKHAKTMRWEVSGSYLAIGAALGLAALVREGPAWMILLYLFPIILSVRAIFTLRACLRELPDWGWRLVRFVLLDVAGGTMSLFGMAVAVAGPLLVVTQKSDVSGKLWLYLLAIPIGIILIRLGSLLMGAAGDLLRPAFAVVARRLAQRMLLTELSGPATGTGITLFHPPRGNESGDRKSL